MLGAALDDLHERLGAYFGAIPAGHVGRGHGVFDVVGTPRRWLWPILAVLGREGIAFPAWAHGVAFDVENRPTRTHEGDAAVSARRTFHLSGGDRAMVDEIAADNRGPHGDWRLVDRLGPGRLVQASFGADVRGGALVLRSTGVGVRLGAWVLPILRPLAPVVRLTERFDGDRERQHVSITLSMPVIGRIYEYSGFFTYRIEPDTASVVSEGES
ncbi:DUF4166 domain-containing protein [Frondihabitans australicus]|uniref:Uncharacterized protein DUF4166 n=1 Tax=Frondihabitans australicus TaxID=386892 RepID=A0A495IGM0_9MICO|nr:DUF4166 domain-containing protein [Frondihabitans australicus]RKR75137.1 uncharacterized protein DUF4166 [Frondihabitans australicus]